MLTNNKHKNNYPFIPPLCLSNKMAKVLVAIRDGIKFKRMLEDVPEILRIYNITQHFRKNVLHISKFFEVSLRFKPL